MADYFLSKKHSKRFFDPLIPPVLTVNPGDTVTFETDCEYYRALDAGDIRYDEKEESANTVTGPVFISGAGPGDTLRIDILDIHIDHTWAVWFPDYSGFKTDQVQIKKIPVDNGSLRITETISVPLAPMVGCIGLAPASGISSAYVPVYPWGGNLDLPELRSGATLFLPVQVQGALLSLGDLHAAMGRGEPLSVGLEGGGRVTVRLDIEKNMSLSFPRIHLESSVLCVGLGDTIDQARTCAIDQAFQVLTNEWHLSPFDAFCYASACLGLRFGGPAADIVLSDVPFLTHKTRQTAKEH